MELDPYIEYIEFARRLDMAQPGDTVCFVASVSAYQRMLAALPGFMRDGLIRSWTTEGATTLVMVRGEGERAAEPPKVFYPGGPPPIEVALLSGGLSAIDLFAKFESAAPGETVAHPLMGDKGAETRDFFLSRGMASSATFDERTRVLTMVKR